AGTAASVSDRVRESSGFRRGLSSPPVIVCSTVSTVQGEAAGRFSAPGLAGVSCRGRGWSMGKGACDPPRAVSGLEPVECQSNCAAKSQAAGVLATALIFPSIPDTCLVQHVAAVRRHRSTCPPNDVSHSCRWQAVIPSRRNREGMGTYLADIWRCRYFWLSLVKMDLRTRYRRSVLGLGWSLLHPIAMTTILCIVFQRIFHVDLRDYAPRVLSGLTFWNYLVSVTILGCQCFFHGEAYIRQH